MKGRNRGLILRQVEYDGCQFCDQFYWKRFRMNSRNLSTKANKIATTENKQTKLQQRNNIT